MARTSRIQPPKPIKTWNAALYTRLSREDGDKPESDSIGNQRALLEHYLSAHTDLTLTDFYADDGFTGTSFNRPDFRRMLQDIESQKINCVVVKDLSRFGRDYIDTGHYLERWFPEHGVRFVAINDNIDSERAAYDMLLPVKNVFNEQYARDISAKVKSAFKSKQQRGEFVGAFASYGYCKHPDNHNKLVIDPVAAPVVKRIFNLFERGTGKIRIAKLLNEEKIPCPSEYKRLTGERYQNGQRIGSTTYWTYATIHRMLKNQIYAGHMEQGRNERVTIHGKAKQLERDQWIVVEDTHTPIISQDQWERVASLLDRDTRSIDFAQNVSPFAGFLRCGDCGRAMSKTNHSGGTFYCCGSYKRYGPAVCSRHSISHRDLEQIVLADLNNIIAAIGNLREIVERAAPPPVERRILQVEQERYHGMLERVYRLKKSSYEDYHEGLISREDYLRYREDYDRQETQLSAQLDALTTPPDEESILEKPWVKALLKHGGLTELDRATVAETISKILILEDGEIEITYTFCDDLGVLNTE